MGKKHGKISNLRRWISAIVCVLLFAVVIASASGHLRTFRVTSDSMKPTIWTGDLILVDCREPVMPHRGDIVGVKNPHDVDAWLCKRVVAVPNDRVQFLDGYFHLNGHRMMEEDQPYVMTDRVAGLLDTWEYELGEDEYFVLGDNRAESYDSLDFGPVKTEDFIGIALRIYWPPGRARPLIQDHGKQDS